MLGRLAVSRTLERKGKILKNLAWPLDACPKKPWFLVLNLFMVTLFFYFARSPEKFYGLFFEFAWNFALKNGEDFETKHENSSKILGKFGAKFGANFGMKIREIREAFVLQLFWPNIFGLRNVAVYAWMSHGTPLLECILSQSNSTNSNLELCFHTLPEVSQAQVTRFTRTLLILHMVTYPDLLSLDFEDLLASWFQGIPSLLSVFPKLLQGFEGSN